MRVLVPLPFDVSQMAHGRNLRIVHLLRELAHRCDLVCVTPDQRITHGARRVLPDLRISPADLGPGRGETTRLRVQGSYWLRRAISFLGSNRSLLAAVAERAAQADVVLGFDLPSVVYLLAADGRVSIGSAGSAEQAPRPRTVCDLIDDPWLLRQSFPITRRCSPHGIKSAVGIRVIRRELLGTFDALTVVGRQDADSLSRATGARVNVVVNGVREPAEPASGCERELLVAFTGAMDFPPNVTAASWFVRRVWPEVLRRFSRRLARAEANTLGPGAGPPLQLAIVGADPVPKVQRLSGQAGVIVTGRVPDVAPWLSRARVAVAPMVSGCGIKNKVLEACAAACPVVATPLGAAGLPTGKEHGIIVADTPEQTAEAVAELLVDFSASRAIGAAARAMVRKRFSWSKSADALMAVLAGNGNTTLSAGRQPAAPGLPSHRRRSAAGHGQPDNQETLTHAAS